jgi:hypothetical protein
MVMNQIELTFTTCSLRMLSLPGSNGILEEINVSMYYIKKKLLM